MNVLRIANLYIWFDAIGTSVRTRAGGASSPAFVHLLGLLRTTTMHVQKYLWEEPSSTVRTKAEKEGRTRMSKAEKPSWARECVGLLKVISSAANNSNSNSSSSFSCDGLDGLYTNQG